MDLLDGFGHAQRLFAGAVESLGDDPWQGETACRDWTVADVVGHATWGQDLIRSLASGEGFDASVGGPGSASPAEYAGDDPWGAWQRAREAAARALTPDRLDVPLPEGMVRDGATVGTFAEILELDTITHAWDITRPHGIDLDVSDEQLARISDTAHRVVQRRPGFFDPEIAAPAGSDPLTALMAFCGRADPRQA